MAAGDLTTLAAVKDWLDLTVTGDDAKLTTLITAVSTFIQSWLNRQLASAQYTETRDGTGTKRLTLTNYPVTAVASVTLDALPLTQGTDYVFDLYGIELTNGAKFTPDVGNVVVTYTGGYSPVPADIQQACLELVALRYLRRKRPDVSSKTQGNETAAYAADSEMPASIKAVLSQYRRVVQP